MSRPNTQQRVETPHRKTEAYIQAHHAIKNLINTLPNISGDPIDVQAQKVIDYLVSTGWVHNWEATHAHHDWEIELNRTMEAELPDSPTPE